MKHLLYSSFLIMFFYDATAQTPKAKWVGGFGVEANRGISSLNKAFSSRSTSTFYNLRFRSNFDFVLGAMRVQKERRLFVTGIMAGWGEMYDFDRKYSMSSIPVFAIGRYKLASMGPLTVTADGKLGGRYFYSDKKTELNNKTLFEYGLGLSAIVKIDKDWIPINLSVQYVQTENFQFISTGIGIAPIPF